MLAADLYRYKLLRDVNHAVFSTAAALGVVFAWICLRLPDGSLMLATGALLCMRIIYDVRTAKERVELIILTLTLSAVLQFLFAALFHQKILLCVIPPLFIFCVLRLVPNKKAAMIVMILGHLGLKTTTQTWYTGINLMLDFSVPMASLMLFSILIPVVHVKGCRTPAWPGGWGLWDSIKITLLLMIGTWLMFALRMPNGVWIPLTVAFLYFRGGNGDFMPTLNARIIGTAAGLFLGWLFLGAFVWMNERAAYALVIMIGYAFFLQFRTKSYFLYTIFFMMTFCMYSDIMEPVGTPLNFPQ